MAGNSGTTTTTATITTTTNYCSPSRSSLSCCQADSSSQNGGLERANNNYSYVHQQEKHSFPKRPEVDLQFRDIRYRVKSWSVRSIRPGE